MNAIAAGCIAAIVGPVIVFVLFLVALHLYANPHMDCVPTWPHA